MMLMITQVILLAFNALLIREYFLVLILLFANIILHFFMKITNIFLNLLRIF